MNAAAHLLKAVQVVDDPAEDVYRNRSIHEAGPRTPVVEERQLGQIVRPIEQPPAVHAVESNIPREGMESLVLRFDAKGRVNVQIGLRPRPHRVPQLAVIRRAFPDDPTGLRRRALQEGGERNLTAVGEDQSQVFGHADDSLCL